jgi:hypothetical protein
MKDVVNALKGQLDSNATLLAYAKDSGYVAHDPRDLVQTNKFPFYNILPMGTRIEKVGNVSFKELERVVYTVSIQFATRAQKVNIAMLGDSTRKGIFDFQEDLWSAITADRTLSGAVYGILPGSSVNIDMIETEDQERLYIAGAEMTIEFYRDRPVA